MFEKLKENFNAAPKAVVWTLSIYLVVSFLLTLLTWRWSKFGGFLLTLLLFYHLLDRGQIARNITIGCLILGALFGLSISKVFPFLMIPLAIGFLYFAWYLAFSEQVKAWLQPRSMSEVEAFTSEE